MKTSTAFGCYLNKFKLDQLKTKTALKHFVNSLCKFHLIQESLVHEGHLNHKRYADWYQFVLICCLLLYGNCSSCSCGNELLHQNAHECRSVCAYSSRQILSWSWAYAHLTWKMCLLANTWPYQKGYKKYEFASLKGDI